MLCQKLKEVFSSLIEQMSDEGMMKPTYKINIPNIRILRERPRCVYYEQIRDVLKKIPKSEN